jgi:hypothetical protein
MDMALFTTGAVGGYSRRQMPQPKTGNGPWGDAIRYWLRRRNMQQADLMRAIKDMRETTTANTISNAALGRDCHTKTLRIIAAALNVSIDEVLVSPDRKSDAEARKLMIQEITERVVRTIDTPIAPSSLPPSLAHKVKELSQATEDETIRQESIRARNRPKMGRKK